MFIYIDLDLQSVSLYLITIMDHTANQWANQSLDHVPFGGDPAMGQGRPGGLRTATVMVTYTTLAVKNPSPAAPEISNRIGCAHG